MKVEKWTLGLAAVGLITLTPALLAQTPAPASIPMLTTLSATTISGYVDTSAVWNPGTGNLHPAPYAFNAGKQDGFNLDAVDVKIAHPQEETGWSAGYVAELSYGNDAEIIDSGAYPIRQAYVALHMPVGNGIDWEFGRFDNILGYESSDSYKNPNFSRSYAYSFEPTEHTGLLGSYNITSQLNIQLGVADTVTTLDANGRTTGPSGTAIESKKSFLSLLTYTAPDSWGAFKGSAFYAGFDYGQGAPRVNVPAFEMPVGLTPAKDKKELYIGTTLNTPVTGLTFGASWDAIFHNDVGGFDESYFQSFCGYLSYKATDKLTLSGRAEYAQGMGLGAAAGTIPTEVADGEGFETVERNIPLNKVFALTATAQYDLWANVITRLEVRWDHAANGNNAFGGRGTTDEFGDTEGLPTKKNEVMVAANVIYKF
ncbi:MAG TPA: outer membrane beta-barrel protein [Verrucomicrobiae bacterium]|jgi:hypothetical protein